jgi:formate C-acetyltransferase
VVDELLRQGKTLADARAGGTSGCVETGAFGKEAYILTGYFNLPKILEIALQEAEPPAHRSFDALFAAFTATLQRFADIKMRGANVIERLYATRMPAPFLSILIDDCICKGQDYNAGGARYNTTYIMPVGIGTLTDSLSAIKCHVFDREDLRLPSLVEALRRNFDGDESLRQTLWNRTPRYGNDDPDADAMLARVFDAVYDAVEGRPNTRGGEFPSTTCPRHVMCISDRRWGRRRTAGVPSSQSRKAFHRCRVQTASGRRRRCAPPRGSTTRAPAARS